jgi:predicted nuclease with TOPRIM domain
MRLLGAGLTSLVAVLAIVVLQQVQQQASRSRALERRVQALENRRDLERTQALEAQLHATVQRLQGLEANASQLQELLLQQEEQRRQLERQLLKQNLQPPELLPFADPMPAPGKAIKPGAKAAKSPAKPHPYGDSIP